MEKLCLITNKSSIRWKEKGLQWEDSVTQCKDAVLQWKQSTFTWKVLFLWMWCTTMAGVQMYFGSSWITAFKSGKQLGSSLLYHSYYRQQNGEIWSAGSFFAHFDSGSTVSLYSPHSKSFRVYMTVWALSKSIFITFWSWCPDHLILKVWDS